MVERVVGEVLRGRDGGSTTIELTLDGEPATLDFPIESTGGTFRPGPATLTQGGEMLSIEDVLEILASPLLGIVPESQDVLRASNVGSPVTVNNPASAPARAYLDATRRLLGETVQMTVPAGKIGLMNRLLGRRAA